MNPVLQRSSRPRQEVIEVRLTAKPLRNLVGKLSHTPVGVPLYLPEVQGHKRHCLASDRQHHVELPRRGGVTQPAVASARSLRRSAPRGSVWVGIELVRVILIGAPPQLAHVVVWQLMSQAPLLTFLLSAFPTQKRLKPVHDGDHIAVGDRATAAAPFTPDLVMIHMDEAELPKRVFASAEGTLGELMGLFQLVRTDPLVDDVDRPLVQLQAQFCDLGVLLLQLRMKVLSEALDSFSLVLLPDLQMHQGSLFDVMDVGTLVLHAEIAHNRRHGQAIDRFRWREDCVVDATATAVGHTKDATPRC